MTASLNKPQIHLRNSIGIATILRAGWAGFVSRQGQEIFLSSITTRPGLEPMQPPIQRLLSAVFPGVKRQGRESDHSYPSSAEVKNG
jgi:hypothetical protein